MRSKKCIGIRYIHSSHSGLAGGCRYISGWVSRFPPVWSMRSGRSINAYIVRALMDQDNSPASKAETVAEKRLANMDQIIGRIPKSLGSSATICIRKVASEISPSVQFSQDISKISLNKHSHHCVKHYSHHSRSRRTQYKMAKQCPAILGISLGLCGERPYGYLHVIDRPLACRLYDFGTRFRTSCIFGRRSRRRDRRNYSIFFLDLWKARFPLLPYMR